MKKKHYHTEWISNLLFSLYAVVCKFAIEHRLYHNLDR